MMKSIAGAGKVIKGSLTVPGDKSISHRAVMFSALAKGETKVKGFLPGEDCLSTISVFRKMGVSIEQEQDSLRIQGLGLHGLKAPGEALYCGNSGTTMRLMAGILAGQSFSSCLTGDESLEKRPMKRVCLPLEKMGAKIKMQGEKGTAPLEISGSPLNGICYESPVASAQVKSSVLLAGLYAKGKTSLIEPSLSRDHTERLLRAMGVECSTRGLEDGRVEISLEGGQELKALPGEYFVPGDISSAAYFMASVFFLPGSSLRLKNIGLNPSRCGILTVLEKMGAKISLENCSTVYGEERGDICLSYGPLKAVDIGGDLIPRLIDELPLLAVLATIAEGETRIYDAAELKVKESNRIKACVENLQRLGISAVETADGMIIPGKGSVFSLEGKRIPSFMDHRIAMSFSVLGLLCKAENPMQIEDSECIQISYPNFFKDFEKVLDEG
ncbi:3-phosphoshikimate 1-carboxyvinyltransferase [Oribacterium sinus]|uniref:3-phosphoshikimate 1-carboxyvinyltransferase n=1 Tax=Oribacterium sinus TaxID=237576 RepID=UPI0028D5A11F|nr:3-phosphoshikimate 1-carboxyvinyltransferase [Oribacterium sinus]